LTNALLRSEPGKVKTAAVLCLVSVVDRQQGSCAARTGCFSRLRDGGEKPTYFF